LLCIVAGVLLLTPGWVGAQCVPPEINGDLNDMITYANCPDVCGHDIIAPYGDVCKTIDFIVGCNQETPCPLTRERTSVYLHNGQDLIRVVMAYDRANQTLYLGARVADDTAIGDVDAGGTWGEDCQVATMTDAVGIGPDEAYYWQFDLNATATSMIWFTRSKAKRSPTRRVW
jgi:hypothetical protein